MKKIIILFEIMTIIFMLNLAINKSTTTELNIEKKSEEYIMTSTGYSNDLRCINKENFDGMTATGVPIKEGIIAINVDYIDGKWQVNSPLKLGQKVFINGLGTFEVQDTGSFTEKDFHFDFWNVDIFYKNYDDAKKHGVKKINIKVLGNN